MEEAKARGSVRRTTSRSISRNRSTAWRMEDVFTGGVGGSYNRRSSRHSEEDEEALRWAALEKLPTYDRLRTTIMKSYMNDDDENQRGGYNKNNVIMHKEVDVRKLDPNDRQEFIDRIFKVAEEDNEKFLMKFRNRIDK